MAAFRSAGFGRRGGLQEAFAQLRLEDEPDLEVRLDRFVDFACGIVVPMGPLVWVLGHRCRAGPDDARPRPGRAPRPRAMCEDLVELLVDRASRPPTRSTRSTC